MLLKLLTRVGPGGPLVRLRQQEGARGGSGGPLGSLPRPREPEGTRAGATGPFLRLCRQGGSRLGAILRFLSCPRLPTKGAERWLS